MQTKAYFASSVPAALEVARQELGENALLVGSRPAPMEAQRFGRLEVTFAWDPSKQASSEQTMQEHRQPANEMDEIRQQLSALRRAVGRSELAGPGLAISSARDIAGRIPVAPFVEMKAGECRTLAFIGPPGRGKTTSLVKIALQFGLARRVPVRIYSTGAHAIGAQEQIARYAAILGTPFQTCESLASLNLALNGDGWKGLILIDTPGISPADRNELDELTRFLAGRAEIEKHLVLRADAAPAEMSHTMSRFAGLAPSRLLFTGIDEALQLNAVVETLIAGSVPATFCGTGQQIPEDLEEVSADRLARAVCAAPVTQGRSHRAAA